MVGMLVDCLVECPFYVPPPPPCRYYHRQHLLHRGRGDSSVVSLSVVAGKRVYDLFAAVAVGAEGCWKCSPARSGTAARQISPSHAS